MGETDVATPRRRPCGRGAGNQNWAVKTYKRAAVFMRGTAVNRGHSESQSVHASGEHTAVRASDCDFGGSFHVQHESTFSRIPEVRGQAV